MVGQIGEQWLWARLRAGVGGLTTLRLDEVRGGLRILDEIHRKTASLRALPEVSLRQGR